MSATPQSQPATEEHGAAYEAQHVHAVYEQIASHFSSTRYKPWPIVERFLKEQVPGAVGADVGCGNGKYLAVNGDVFVVGSDRSSNLINIAKRHEPHDALVADNLSLPHPNGVFDFAISIAVIHHLSTPERRVEAVRCVLNLLRRPAPRGKEDQESSREEDRKGSGCGRALFYVWALEQKDSRRGWDEGHEQDVMVPWVLKQKKTEDQTFLRYYHLYQKGELEKNVNEAGGVVLEAGYEKDNWWVIAGVK